MFLSMYNFRQSLQICGIFIHSRGYVANFPFELCIQNDMQCILQKKYEVSNGSLSWIGCGDLRSDFRFRICWYPVAVHIVFCKTTVCHSVIAGFEWEV